FKKAEKISKQSRWPQSATERLRAIKSEEGNTVELVYTMLSQVVHASVSSAAGFYSQNEKNISYLVGPTAQEIELSLMIVMDFFRVVARSAYDAFGVNRKLLNEYVAQFDQIRATSVGPR